jgi:hypothetical protein
VRWGSFAPSEREQTWSPVRGVNLNDLAVENDSCLRREKERAAMRDDLKPGNKFPDIALPNHDKETVTLSSLVRGFPTVLVFSRGYF